MMVELGMMGSFQGSQEGKISLWLHGHILGGLRGDKKHPPRGFPVSRKTVGFGYFLAKALRLLQDMACCTWPSSNLDVRNIGH
jgi:hypothetical protein